jgi:hypothetical protein
MDASGILDLLEHIPRDARLRERTEAGPGIPETPRRQLNRQRFDSSFGLTLYS